MLASSHRAVPSLRASRRSPGGSERPRVSSIHVRASLAACGVYLERRRLRMSESSEVTDGMVRCLFLCVFDFIGRKSGSKVLKAVHVRPCWSLLRSTRQMLTATGNALD
jgi:hypothetical protein